MKMKESMNNLEIMVRIKNVYGTDKIYPVSPNAHLFADIAGTTTLRPSDLKAIQELGYRVLIEQQTYGEHNNVR
jgi:ATP phosphoribosyltransferase